MDRFFHSLLLGLLALLFSHSSFGQKTLTVTDPEIEFSIETPENWVEQDDGYYYILICPSESKMDHISITYFETRDTSPNDQFDGTIQGALPIKLNNFKLVEKGNDRVDNQPAKWAIFSWEEEGIPIKSLLYMFISQGQIFQIQANASAGTFEKQFKHFKSAIRSIKARKL